MCDDGVHANSLRADRIKSVQRRTTAVKHRVAFLRHGVADLRHGVALRQKAIQEIERTIRTCKKKSWPNAQTHNAAVSKRAARRSPIRSVYEASPRKSKKTFCPEGKAPLRTAAPRRCRWESTKRIGCVADCELR